MEQPENKPQLQVVNTPDRTFEVTSLLQNVFITQYTELQTQSDHNQTIQYLKYIISLYLDLRKAGKHIFLSLSDFPDIILNVFKHDITSNPFLNGYIKRMKDTFEKYEKENKTTWNISEECNDDVYDDMLKILNTILEKYHDLADLQLHSDRDKIFLEEQIKKIVDILIPIRLNILRQKRSYVNFNEKQNMFEVESAFQRLDFNDNELGKKYVTVCGKLKEKFHILVGLLADAATMTFIPPPPPASPPQSPTRPLVYNNGGATHGGKKHRSVNIKTSSKRG